MIVLLLLFIHLLDAAKILNNDLQVNQDDITLTLTFDTPYDNSVRKSYQDGYLIIRLQDLSMDGSFIKDSLSPLVKNLTVQSQNGETLIIAETSRETLLNVSKSKDGFVMRFIMTKSSSALPPIETAKTNTYFDWMDYSIMFLLALAGAVGIYRLARKKTLQHPIFIEEIKTFHQEEPSQVTLDVRFEKKIDADNRALLLQYNGAEYPIILGEKNLFLSSEVPIKSQKDFDNLIEEHFNILKEKEENAKLRQSSINTHEPLESYKEKASGSQNLFDEE